MVYNKTLTLTRAQVSTDLCGGGGGVSARHIGLHGPHPVPKYQAFCFLTSVSHSGMCGVLDVQNVRVRKCGSVVMCVSCGCECVRYQISIPIREAVRSQNILEQIG